MLPAGLSKVAACAACASATALATRSRTPAFCARRRARACVGPVPGQRGMVILVLQCALLNAG